MQVSSTYRYAKISAFKVREVTRAIQVLPVSAALVSALFYLYKIRVYNDYFFALRRYVSNEGDVLSLPEFRALLTPVGLTAARGFDMPIQQVVVAHRGDVPWPDTATAA